jgi:hypothetical protein
VPPGHPHVTDIVADVSEHYTRAVQAFPRNVLCKRAVQIPCTILAVAFAAVNVDAMRKCPNAQMFVVDSGFLGSEGQREQVGCQNNF